GVQRGDRVAILADNRVLWPVADIGILMAGAVSVGVYPTSAPNQIRDQLADCDAVAIVVDTVEHLASVLAVADELPTLRRIVGADVDVPTDRTRSWRDYLTDGALALAKSATISSDIDARVAAAAPD